MMARPDALWVVLALTLTAGVASCRDAKGPKTGVWRASNDECLSDICWLPSRYLPRRMAVLKSQVCLDDNAVFVDKRLRKGRLARGKKVLDIGTGTGFLALITAAHGAREVVATDINPVSWANTVYNALLFGWQDKIDVRLVSLSDPGAYSVVRDDEKFDLIIANPPWDNKKAINIDQLKDLDEGYKFLRSIVLGARDHLAPGGRLLLLFGHPEGLKVIRKLLQRKGLKATFISSDGVEDFSAHKIKAREDDYTGPSPVLEITP